MLKKTEKNLQELLINTVGNKNFLKIKDIILNIEENEALAVSQKDIVGSVSKIFNNSYLKIIDDPRGGYRPEDNAIIAWGETPEAVERNTLRSLLMKINIENKFKN